MAEGDCHKQTSAAKSISTTTSSNQWITTMIDGRFINPLKLENMLRARFGEQYRVEVSSNNS